MERGSVCERSFEDALDIVEAEGVDVSGVDLVEGGEVFGVLEDGEQVDRVADLGYGGSGGRGGVKGSGGDEGNEEGEEKDGDWTETEGESGEAIHFSYVRGWKVLL